MSQLSKNNSQIDNNIGLTDPPLPLATTIIREARASEGVFATWRLLNSTADAPPDQPLFFLPQNQRANFILICQAYIIRDILPC